MDEEKKMQEEFLKLMIPFFYTGKYTIEAMEKMYGVVEKEYEKYVSHVSSNLDKN